MVAFTRRDLANYIQYKLAEELTGGKGTWKGNEFAKGNGEPLVTFRDAPSKQLVTIIEELRVLKKGGMPFDSDAFEEAAHFLHSTLEITKAGKLMDYLSFKTLVWEVVENALDAKLDFKSYPGNDVKHVSKVTREVKSGGGRERGGSVRGSHIGPPPVMMRPMPGTGGGGE